MTRITILFLGMVLAGAVFGRVQGHIDRSNREKIVNDTLTMVLVVGMEAKERGEHPTWGVIASRTAAKMKVEYRPIWQNPR